MARWLVAEFAVNAFLKAYTICLYNLLIPLASVVEDVRLFMLDAELYGLLKRTCVIKSARDFDEAVCPVSWL